MKGGDGIICFIIVILSAFLILALWKWWKWKFTTLSTMIFVVDKYREPTEEEIKYYGRIVVNKLFRSE